ncbi:hypothetical protein Hanom_Chr15g01400541 [Helianthus anomalus]
MFFYKSVSSLTKEFLVLTVLVFRKIEAYTFLLTPFMKVTPYPRCEQKFVMFTSTSSFLLPTNFVENTIGVSKQRGTMKVYVNSWNWFDVFIEKDSLSKCYFFTHGWKIIRHLGLSNEFLVPKAAMENMAGGVGKHFGTRTHGTSARQVASLYT